MSPLIGATLKLDSVAKQLVIVIVNVIVKYVAIAVEVLSHLIGAALKQGSVAKQPVIVIVNVIVIKISIINYQLLIIFCTFVPYIAKLCTNNIYDKGKPCEPPGSHAAVEHVCTRILLFRRIPQDTAENNCVYT